MISLQDQLEEAENVRRMMLGILLFGEELLKRLRSQADYNPKNYPDLPDLMDNLDVLHERLRGISLAIGKIKDRIETEADPDDGDQAPVSAAEDFGPDEVNLSKAEALGQSKEKIERLMHSLYAHYPEPPLTGGQFVNRVVDNDAGGLPIYMTGEDEDGNEAFEPITCWDIHDGKIVLA